MDNLSVVLEALENAYRFHFSPDNNCDLIFVPTSVLGDTIAILRALAASRTARVIKKEELGKLPQNSVGRADQKRKLFPYSSRQLYPST